MDRWAEDVQNIVQNTYSLFSKKKKKLGIYFIKMGLDAGKYIYRHLNSKEKKIQLSVYISI